MTGDGKTAIEYAQRLDGKTRCIAEQIGWVQAIKTALYFVHAQFSAPRPSSPCQIRETNFPRQGHVALCSRYRSGHENDLELMQKEAPHC
jgi:hypothetical protein